jgi:DNA invertase Pin-like site-specific DNA recombinase
MLIGYARVSKADGSQSLDLQHDALRAAGVEQAISMMIVHPVAVMIAPVLPPA